MLSDRDITRVLETGELVIEPQLSDLLRPAGLTLHLGAEIAVPQAGVVDMRTGQGPAYEWHRITPDDPFMLKAGQFVLGHTFEKVTVGLSLGFMIEARSTLARYGVSVVQSAMIVDTGVTHRPITLEFSNAGPNDVLLYEQMSVARAIVFELSSPASRGYDQTSRYRNQTDGVGIPRSDLLQGGQ